MKDLLKDRTPEEPPEIAAAKRYIFEQFGVPSSIRLQNDALIITVSSAALANTLRLRTVQLQAACHTDKRLVFRIG